MGRRAIYAIGIFAFASVALSFFTYRRYVVGRAPAEVCAAAGYQRENIPDGAFAVLDSYGMTMDKHVAAARDPKLEIDLAATGVFDLGGGCFAGWAPAVPSDEGAEHLWIVRDRIGYEFAWLTGHRHPRALDDAARLVRAAGKPEGAERP